MTDLDRLEFDNETLLEIPYINIDVPLDRKEVLACKNRITDHIIKNLPADNDRYYIEYKKGSNTLILEDLQQKDKDRLIELFLPRKKN